MAVARSSATVTMQDVFGKTPFPWQEKVIAHMNLMRAPRRGVPPAAILLIQPTGGGKSMVRDTFAAAHGGIHSSPWPCRRERMRRLSRTRNRVRASCLPPSPVSSLPSLLSTGPTADVSSCCRPSFHKSMPNCQNPWRAPLALFQTTRTII